MPSIPKQLAEIGFGLKNRGVGVYILMSQIVYAIFLLVSAFGTGQSEFSYPNLTAGAPFTLTIAAYQSNFDEENTADLAVKDISIMSLRIRKTNISDHEILKISHGGEYFGYDIEVLNSKGKLVGPKIPCQMELRWDDRGELQLRGKPLMLQPGESKVNFLSLGGQFDMTKPGTYTVQASAHTTDDPKSPVVKSNIITITVLSAHDSPSKQP